MEAWTWTKEREAKIRQQCEEAFPDSGTPQALRRDLADALSRIEELEHQLRQFEERSIRARWDLDTAYAEILRLSEGL